MKAQPVQTNSIITGIFITVVAAMIISVGAWVGSSTMNNTLELINNTNAVKTNVVLLEKLTESVNKHAVAILNNTDSINVNSKLIRAVDGKVEDLKKNNNLK